MNCVDAKSRLIEASNPSDLAADPALRDHLEACQQCRDYAEELRLTRLLGSMPVPPASEGFADRALARAWDTAHNQPAKAKSPFRYGVVGLAASVLMAVVLVTQFPGQQEESGVLPDGHQDIEVVQMDPRSTKSVTVRLVSKEALPDATITLTLEGDVALEGYPGSNTLSWQAPIAAGSNHMSLPVALKGEDSGTILVEVRSGNARKQMQVSVQPAVQAVSQRQAQISGSGSQITI